MIHLNRTKFKSSQIKVKNKEYVKKFLFFQKEENDTKNYIKEKGSFKNSVLNNNSNLVKENNQSKSRKELKNMNLIMNNSLSMNKKIQNKGLRRVKLEKKVSKIIVETQQFFDQKLNDELRANMKLKTDQKESKTKKTRSVNCVNVRSSKNHYFINPKFIETINKKTTIQKSDLKKVKKLNTSIQFINKKITLPQSKYLKNEKINSTIKIIKKNKIILQSKKNV